MLLFLAYFGAFPQRSPFLHGHKQQLWYEGPVSCVNCVGQHFLKNNTKIQKFSSILYLWQLV